MLKLFWINMLCLVYSNDFYPYAPELAEFQGAWVLGSALWALGLVGYGLGGGYEA